MSEVPLPSDPRRDPTSDPIRCSCVEFLRELHRLVALGVKVLRRWEGAVWDHERPSVVHLRTPRAMLEKLAYVMANPVAAGLVHHAHQWPGLCTLPHELGRAPPPSAASPSTRDGSRFGFTTSLRLDAIEAITVKRFATPGEGGQMPLATARRLRHEVRAQTREGGLLLSVYFIDRTFDDSEPGRFAEALASFIGRPAHLG